MKRVFRVLHFGRYADETFGGTERAVKNLIRALSNDVESVNLVADRGAAADMKGWACPVVRARALVVLSSTPLSPTMPWIARRLHHKYRFQIAHLNLPDPMQHIAALALPREVKLVISWHSDIVRQKNLLTLYRPLLARLVARADAVVAATPAHFSSMRQLAALSRPDQRHVVPYGFDLSAFKSAHPRTAELRRVYGERVVFALGRHVYYKGFEYLVRAMRDVPDAVLVLGGSGPLTPELKALAAQLGLNERVRFAGAVPEEELPAYYQACDVFCLPSVEPAEAFGIVQVEAMAAGKPVVCCALNNGVTWVNRNGVTGLVVPPRDPRALAGALRRLLDDRALCRTLGAEALERAGREFSLESLRVNMLDVYRSALGG